MERWNFLWSSYFLCMRFPTLIIVFSPKKSHPLTMQAMYPFPKNSLPLWFFLSISFQHSTIFQCSNPSKIQPDSFPMKGSCFGNAWGISILFLELCRDLLNFLFHRAHGLLIFIIYVHNPWRSWCGCIFSKFWCLMEVSKWQAYLDTLGRVGGHSMVQLAMENWCVICVGSFNGHFIF